MCQASGYSLASSKNKKKINIEIEKDINVLLIYDSWLFFEYVGVD